jgi:aryl-alcohol dehydrogenase-like predicted oxidoreductase
LGKFLKAHDINRESVVILTKTFNPDAKAEDLGPAGLVNHRGSSRKVSPADFDLMTRKGELMI